MKLEGPAFKKTFHTLLRSYSAVLFNSNTFLGFLLFGLTLLNPNLGAGGLVALFSAYVFAKLIGMKKEFFRLDYYIYNPLLVGLFLGFYFKLNLVGLLFFITAGIFTFLFTFFLTNVFSYYFRLPVLSLPFVIVSSLFYLASQNFPELFVENLYLHYQFFQKLFPFKLWLPLSGYFRCLGAIFFMPHVFAGLLIFLVLLGVSRILVFLSILGYLCGTLVHYLFSGSFNLTFQDVYGFNYILSAMAIGGVFLVPSLLSYFLAGISAMVMVPVIEGIRFITIHFNLPILALPFNLITHLFLYSLYLLKHFYLVSMYKGTPEKTLDYYLTTLKRFPFTGRELALPFSGEWTVWQGFDGKWTHKGPWKYSIDFVITDDRGRTFSNQGYHLTDYYAFGKPVLSPVEGRVIKVVNDIRDNPPGEVNKENNWGNYVAIEDKRGFYVFLCHFKEGSIRVKEGQYVVKGEFLGLCGNSGYSPEPHLHLHLSYSPEITSPTVEFSFASYLTNNMFKDIAVPKEGERVSPCFVDRSLYKKLNFMIDQEIEYILQEKDREIPFKIKVEMDSMTGTFYFTDEKAKLYFGIKEGVFYFYSFEGSLSSPLKYFFYASPKIPLVYKEKLKWEDYLPLISISNPLKREFLLFLSSFKHDLAELKVTSFWKEPDVFETIIWGKENGARVRLSHDFGFEEIILKEIKIYRKRA